MIRGKVNCILTVKVPRIHLSPGAREEITARGHLWGTDVYTDDSDVVAACIHGGWIKGEWNEDFDMQMLDLDHHGEKRRKNKEPANNIDLHSEQLITSPPTTGPMPIPVDRDLHIDVVVLPRLSKYSATTRFGISSREFGGEFGNRHVAHDGLSFMVHGIRWVENGAQPQARLRGKARRERMRKAMQEVRVTVSNMNGPDSQDNERLGRLRGEATNNWWRKEASQGDTSEAEKGAERGASEGDKENRVEGAQSLVAEKTEDPDQAAQVKEVTMEEVPAKEEAVQAEQ